MKIKNYMQFVSELAALAARQAGVSGYTTKLGITESQLVNLLKDKQGVIVCGNYPAVDISRGRSYWQGERRCLLMVLQKTPKDQQGTDKELDDMARLEQLMDAIVGLLTDGINQFCDSFVMDGDTLRVEWEYNIYGGFNGLSVTFSLTVR